MDRTRTTVFEGDAKPEEVFLAARQYDQRRVAVYLSAMKFGWSNSVALKRALIQEGDIVRLMEEFPEMASAYHRYLDQMGVSKHRRREVPLRRAKG